MASTVRIWTPSELPSTILVSPGLMSIGPESDTEAIHTWKARLHRAALGNGAPQFSFMSFHI